jgi:hypothetical protein
MMAVKLSPVATTHDRARCSELCREARGLIADNADGEFPFPDMRSVDLAVRLVAPGPKACAVTASECHEITKVVIDAYDRDGFPVRARKIIDVLVSQLEAANAEVERLELTLLSTPARHGSTIQEIAAECDTLRAETRLLRAALSRVCPARSPKCAIRGTCTNECGALDVHDAHGEPPP